MTKKIFIMVSVVMLIALVGCSQETVEVTTTTKTSTTAATTTTTSTVTNNKGWNNINNKTDNYKTNHNQTKAYNWKGYNKESYNHSNRKNNAKANHYQKGYTTTSDCKGKNDHGMPCGNVGKWYSSKEDFKAEYMAESDKWNAKLDNEEIDWDTYIHSVAGGYELWSCPNCGKWTGNYKYR